MIAALQIEYPGLLQMGCYFHFSQCLLRKVQALHLKPTYENDVAFRVIIRQFCAIAFVPIPVVPETFDMLVRSIPRRYVAMLAGFVAYYQVCTQTFEFLRQNLFISAVCLHFVRALAKLKGLQFSRQKE